LLAIDGRWKRIAIVFFKVGKEDRPSSIGILIRPFVVVQRQQQNDNFFNTN
jgi:hypothetical protein